MSAKLDRLGAELAKARKKKAEWDAKVKDLERRYREEENSEIHEMECYNFGRCNVLWCLFHNCIYVC